jgi:hypothetical protein
LLSNAGCCAELLETSAASRSRVIAKFERQDIEKAP